MDHGNLDWTRYQDIAGQTPSLQGYTQLCLFFPVEQPQAKQKIVQLVESTSIKIVSNFPWLSGQVSNQGSTPKNSGIFKIGSYREHGTGLDIIVKDLDMTYRDVIERNAPMEMLHGQLLSTRSDMTRIYDFSKTPGPVMVLQLSFVQGGVIITFAAAHNIMDLNGLGTFISLFGRISTGEEVTKNEMEWGNVDRKRLFSLLDPTEKELDHSMLIVDPTEKKSGRGNPALLPSKAIWAYVRFKREKLSNFKTTMLCDINTEPGQAGSEWLSTDDVLSAFIWKHITLARQARCSPKSTLCRVINARRLLSPPVSTYYLGHLVSCTYNTTSLQNLTIQPLSVTALALRKTLLQQNDYAIRSFNTFIHRHENKGVINYTARMDLSRDLLISSGASLGVSNVDFGPLLGKPDCVRRPRWDAAEGVVYFMPKSRDGDIDAAICLRCDDWEILKADKAWREFGEHIG